MAYTPLQLPADIEPELKAIVRGAAEQYLRDVHRMLATADPLYGPSDQLQHSAAGVLLATISGASSVLYGKYTGQPGKQFKGVLRDFYPWELDQPKGVSPEGAANLLYKIYRNPGAHRFGLTSGKKTVKIGKVFRGSKAQQAELSRLEQSPGGAVSGESEPVSTTP